MKPLDDLDVIKLAKLEAKAARKAGKTIEEYRRDQENESKNQISNKQSDDIPVFLIIAIILVICFIFFLIYKSC